MSRLLILYCVIVGVLAKPPHEKCKLTDTACLLKMANTLYASLFSLSSDLDPMHLDIIEGILPTLNYTITDGNVKGLKDCQIEEFNLDLDKLTNDYTFICPHLDMDGNYVVNGILKDVPVEGAGTYTQTATKYAIRVQLNIDLQAKDRKTVIDVKDFKVSVDPRERVVSKINNLFNGDEEKAAKVLRVFNEDWKTTIKALHGPIVSAYFNNIIEVAKELFQKIFLEDFITV